MKNYNETKFKAIIMADSINVISTFLNKLAIKLTSVDCKTKVLSPILTNICLFNTTKEVEQYHESTMDNIKYELFGSIKNYNCIDDELIKLFDIYNDKDKKVSTETAESIKSIKIILSYTDINFETQTLTKKTLLILPKLYNGRIHSNITELNNSILDFTVNNIKKIIPFIKVYSKDDALNNLEYYFKPEALNDLTKIKYNLSHMNDYVYREFGLFIMKSGCLIEDFNKI